MTKNRRAGRIYLKVDGVRYDAKGSFSYNLGAPKRTAIVGADKVHGFSEEVQVPYIEGEITDSPDFDLRKFTEIDGATITLELGNGKVISLREAWYAAEGKGETKEANIEVRFEGLDAEEVR
ncbi:phage tail tube protein [Ferrovibrio terrae]|uniref:phage tail tube protein n=1 Tax=Ferrovibrio terrae TaxID=2594003 RepID=UPI0031382187